MKKQLNNIQAQTKENFNLDIIKLDNKTTIDDNDRGKKLKWYGKRLFLIRNFYNKTAIELCIYLNISTTKVSDWELNKAKPTPKEIEKLAFLFEVKETFFTNEEIGIIINEQITFRA